MITPREILQKVERRYLDFLRAWLQGTPFFPLDIPVGALPKDYMKLREGTRQLIEHEKMGYRVELEATKTRLYGEQSLLKRIIIDDEAAFLKLIKKQNEFQAFQRDAARIRAYLPQLETWMLQAPQQVINYHGRWDDLLAVCAYFLENPRPNRYIRELPIEIHTKFVEQHKGILVQLLDALLAAETITAEKEFEKRYGLRYEEPLIRLRFLDKGLQKAVNSTFSDMSVPLSELAATIIPCRSCLIVENKMTFLTLPTLPNTLAIWGAGYRVEALRELLWLADKSIYYWGDLDAQGFEILSRLRSIFPQTKSVLMDEYTFIQFAQYCTTGTPSNRSKLDLLTPAEAKLYQQLAGQNQRLEQEHIAHAFIVKRLKAMIDDF